jgi:hypothetical protein
VLYTGPMFQVRLPTLKHARFPQANPPNPPNGQVYNTILRRYPTEEYNMYKDGGNLFPTTIAVLASAVIKIARATKLPVGLLLYRGLGGLMDLPESFWKADGNGCRGYMEFGFMSTTSSKATALEYSGARERRPKPMVRQSPPLFSAGAA